MSERSITLSIVSHRQNGLVNQLLGDIQRHCADRVTLVLTENVPDPTPLTTAGLTCPVQRIANDRIKGFGANHNAAFKYCQTPYFCVVNPDIRLPADPFPALISNFADKTLAVAAPLVRNPAGTVEDSARRYPTPGLLVRKLLGANPGQDYPIDRGPIQVDWVAGMFMLFRSDAYRDIGGFDEAYFLYYEDVDLCRRLRRAGSLVRYVPAADVVHDARRASRFDPRLAAHHLASMARFLSGR